MGRHRHACLLAVRPGRARTVTGNPAALGFPRQIWSRITGFNLGIEGVCRKWQTPSTEFGPEIMGVR